MHWIAVAPVPMIADPLVGELVRSPFGVAAGVVVVPAAGVEGVALELSMPGMPGSFGWTRVPADITT